MFSVYAEKGGQRKTLYNDSWLMVGEYGSSVVASDMVLTLEDNQAGSFKITLPEANQGYDFVGRYTTELVVYRIRRNNSGAAITETEIFRGRVIGQEEDFLHNRTFIAEGELAYLCDTRQPQKKYAKTMTPRQYFEALLAVHNSKANKSRKFVLGTVEFTEWSEVVTSQIADEDEDNEDNLYRETSYEDTLTCISEGFEDLDNPHLMIRKSGTTRYLDILKDSREGGTWGTTVIPDQEVRLGSNLLDYSKNYDMSDICSVIIPLGAEIEDEEKQRIGPPVSLTYQYGWVLSDQDGKPMQLGNNDQDFCIAGPKSVSPGQLYFYTGRSWNGYGMYTFMNNNDEVVEWRQSNTSASEAVATDLIEERIEVPEGATKLYIGGNGKKIPTRLNTYLDDAHADLDQYVTVKSIVDTSRKKKKGTVYVKSDTLLSMYGWIEKVVEFPNLKTPQVLYNRAIKYLSEDVYENLILEVKALDMNNFDTSLTPYSIGKSVHVSLDNKTTLTFPISKLELNLAEPENSLITLGYHTKLAISGVSTSRSAKISKKIEAIRTNTQESLKDAIDRATYAIKNGMNGYVTLVRDENNNDIIKEIVISTDTNLNSPNNHVWRWNAGGLGFSSTGYDGTYALAMTNQGEIVADRITAGSMSAARIQAGTMSAERIKGGTLTLGGANNVNGTFLMKNASNETMGTWTNDGIISTDGTRSVKIKEASIDGYFNNARIGYLDLAARYSNRQEAVIGSDHDLMFEIGRSGTFHFIQVNGENDRDTCGTIDGGGWHGPVLGDVEGDLYGNVYGGYVEGYCSGISVNGEMYYPDEDGIIEISIPTGNE